MLFVENCTLRVDRFCGDPHFCIFCFPARSGEDFDTVGDFCTREAAESFLRYMQEKGGKISAFRTLAESWEA